MTQNQAIGRSRGGLSTKIHIAVDAIGHPLRMIITAGQVHEATQARILIDGLTLNQPYRRQGLKAGFKIDQVVTDNGVSGIATRLHDVRRFGAVAVHLRNRSRWLYLRGPLRGFFPWKHSSITPKIGKMENRGGSSPT